MIHKREGLQVSALDRTVCTYRGSSVCCLSAVAVVGNVVVEFEKEFVGREKGC